MEEEGEGVQPTAVTTATGEGQPPLPWEPLVMGGHQKGGVAEEGVE